MKKFILASLSLLVNLVFGCWVFVEAPEYLAWEQLLTPDSFTLAIMDSVIRAKVIKSLQEIEEYGEESERPIDVLIFVLKDGSPVTPDAYKGAPERGEITPERGDGWTDAEWNGIMDHWQLAYPIIKEVYGNPLYTLTVEISRDTTISGGVYNGWNNTIKLGDWGTPSYWGILTHEMAHAFRDDKCAWWAHFEEGMAMAAEVIVQNLIYERYNKEGEYPDLYHDDTYYILFQQFNTPAYGTRCHIFSGDYATANPWENLRFIRYYTTGYCWWKVWFVDRDFFKNFNQKLITWPQGYSFLRDIAIQSFNSTLTIEGRTFEDWFNNQPILQNNFATGTELGFSQTPGSHGHNIRIICYERWRGGPPMYKEVENPYDNIVVNAKLWNSTGKIVYNTQLTTSNGNAYIYNINNFL